MAQRHNVQIEDDDKKLSLKVLMGERGYRMVFMKYARRATHPGTYIVRMVSMHAIRGHVTLFLDPSPMNCTPVKSSVLRAGLPHRFEAIEDSVLLVFSYWRLGFLDDALRRTGSVPSYETRTSPAKQRFAKQRFFTHVRFVHRRTAFRDNNPKLSLRWEGRDSHGSGLRATRT